MAEFDNYDNPYATRDHINQNVVPTIYEVLVDSYGIDKEDYNGYATDDAWEVIDGLYEVIYNYPAKKVAQAFGYCPFETVSDFTGERFNNYNEMAFEIIYNRFMDKYADELEDRG